MGGLYIVLCKSNRYNWRRLCFKIQEFVGNTKPLSGKCETRIRIDFTGIGIEQSLSSVVLTKGPNELTEKQFSAKRFGRKSPWPQLFHSGPFRSVPFGDRHDKWLLISAPVILANQHKSMSRRKRGAMFSPHTTYPGKPKRNPTYVTQFSDGFEARGEFQEFGNELALVGSGGHTLPGAPNAYTHVSTSLPTKGSFPVAILRHRWTANEPCMNIQLNIHTNSITVSLSSGKVDVRLFLVGVRFWTDWTPMGDDWKLDSLGCFMSSWGNACKWSAWAIRNENSNMCCHISMLYVGM